MSKISIIIPAFNASQFLADCLESVISQTLEDLEIIVIDDGSTDNSLAIAESFAQQDKRIKVIHQGNQGLHLARATGVQHANGDYTMFLDADDMLESRICEKTWRRMAADPVDILHFGVRVLVEDDNLIHSALEFERFANANRGRLEGTAIKNRIFLESEGYRLDWRTWQRLFDTQFLKTSFELMSKSRLERAEDSHEGFVLASLAKTFDTMDEDRGYIYRYGCGVSTRNSISAQAFALSCRQFKDCIEASETFVNNHPELADAACFEGLKYKCLEILSNDWKNRVDQPSRLESFKEFAEVFGGANAARELYRFIRDESYEAITSKNWSINDAISDYLKIVETIDSSDGLDSEKDRLAHMRSAAKAHLTDMEINRGFNEYNNQRARIFVTMHGYFDKPNDPLFQPVQVGPAQLTDGGRFRSMFHDCDGDNISKDNARYCEMTVQYWAWKNVDAEYYGFCHYRRYFNLSESNALENEWGEVEERFIDEKSCSRYGLDSDSFFKRMGDADVLYTEIKDVSKFPDHNKSVYEHYRNGNYLHIEDLNTLIEVLADLQPDYIDDAQKYLAGSKTCFCNMYVMKRQAFFDYCEWLFPLLEEFERRANMTYYNQQEMRVTGHLAERLFNIYLCHNQRSLNPWKTVEVQCVRFTEPTKPEPLRSAFNDDAIPVVFAADDKYSPMLGTAISSLVLNANNRRNYDIVVLSRGISDYNQELIRRCAQNKPNISIRFYNVTRLVANYELTVNEHITEETYYRFLIQWILSDYPKVLYLDSDIVVNADVAELFDTELGNNLLAAVVDVDWAGICNVRNVDNDRKTYARDVLGMDNPYAYFQAGVLLLNTAAMSSLHSLEEWLSLAATPHIFNDQDVLNAECEGRVRYLDLSWNVLVDTGRVEVAIKNAPIAMFEAYLESRKDSKIIHYAGGIKAWDYPETDFADVFWDYAKQTPFYEILLKRMADKSIDIKWPLKKDEFLYEQGSRSLPRKVVDIVLPYGSERRETIKHLAGRN